MGFRMNIQLRDLDLDLLSDAFRRFSFVKAVSVFGSRAVGGARRDSDLDLAVDASTASATEWGNLCEALEEVPVVYEMDVIRMDEEVADSLRSKINLQGRVIYTKFRS